MKVIIVGPSHPYRGGIAAFTDRLASEFLSENDEVEELSEIQEFDGEYANSEEYSGEYAVKAKMHGYGLGMYYVKKLTEMNEGTVDFIPSSTVIINYNGIPYTKNKIVIKLKRYLD
mgnify:CR=1 FL=1